MSYRILRVERGRVRVEDAQGAPPTIPFWLGEAPGRTDELSHSVSRLRENIATKLGDDGLTATIDWLDHERGFGEAASRQLAEYLAGAKAALGVLPTETELAMERFFDESGGMQLIIHSPLGSRVNRAWGLALRKRFCRSFNFELQAAATEDAIILSLSTSHSFPLDDVAKFLHSNTAREVLIQALLDAPMFGVALALERDRVARAAALPGRQQGAAATAAHEGRGSARDRVPRPGRVPREHRRRAPDSGSSARRANALRLSQRCDGHRRARASVARARVGRDSHRRARDLTEPSPLAAEVLSARPYAYLDDAPLEERRTQAVTSRRWVDPATAADFGQLDVEAIEGVREEAWPEARSADEMHDALMTLGFVTADEVARNPGWDRLVESLAASRSSNPAASFRRRPQPIVAFGREQNGSPAFAGMTKRARGRRFGSPPSGYPQFTEIHRTPNAFRPSMRPAEYAAVEWTPDKALVEVLRSRLTGLGPVRVADLAASIGVGTSDIDIALAALEGEGYVMRGQFTAGHERDRMVRAPVARAHPSLHTVRRLRREIEPVEARDFMRFLTSWQHVAPDARVSGPDALASVLAHARRFRSAGRRVGKRADSGARRGLRNLVARRSVPQRSRAVGATSRRKDRAERRGGSVERGSGQGDARSCCCSGVTSRTGARSADSRPAPSRRCRRARKRSRNISPITARRSSMKC